MSSLAVAVAVGGDDAALSEKHPEARPALMKSSSNDYEDDIEYPEGGLEAWLVVFGALCGMMASVGVYNSSGVFSAVLAQIVLPDANPSKLGWLFGVYGFITWFCGVQVGPTFDVFGPRFLIIAGTVCTTIGFFMFSISTQYYQILLSFSILTGLGSSLLLTPCIGVVAHWFCRRRGFASGIAFLGGGIGGVLFPLTVQALLPRVGWPWSVRVLGFLQLVLCAISIAFCRSRVPPRSGSTVSWRDTLPSVHIFLDGTGAMVLTTFGVVFMELAYFIPVTYLPSYYLARQNLSDQEALTGAAAFAYQLLAILNAVSCGGRAVAGFWSDRYGPFNVMIVSLFLCTVSVLGFWLPDMLTPGLTSDALLVAFVVLYGLVSGSNISLTPICLGQLCTVHDYGRYYASCFTVVALGVLASIPLAGGLLNAVHASGKEVYWGVALFTGLSYIAALACFAAVRIMTKGWDLRTKY